MTNFEFSGRQRTTLFVGLIIGVISMAATWMFGDDALHSRFWSNFLHNSVFFTGIALMAGFFLSASITAWAGWYSLFKRIWEAYSLFLIVGLGLMLVLAIGNYTHWHHLYHWTDTSLIDPANENYDKILASKAPFLNKTWYLGGTIVFISLWYFIMTRIRALSLREDEGNDKDFSSHRKMRVWAAAFLPLAGFGSAAMIWQWIMSVDSHWYSTMFAWYTGASWFVSMIALTILTVMYLKMRGYFTNVTTEHIHDLGKLLFAFSIFWTYLWFSQYMLIWYANVGEETIYFRERFDNYPVLFYGNIVINFVAPFIILMRNDTKRKWGSLSFMAILVFFGHWLDFFLMIKPGVLHTAHEVMSHGAGGHGDAHHALAGFTLPGFLELGTMIGFLSLFLLVVYSTMSRASLEPKHDPYLQESLHHHV